MSAEELQQTKETLLKATQHIGLLSAENARLRARVAQMQKVDPDRIIKLVEEVTGQLKYSESRSESLTKLLQDQISKNRALIEDIKQKDDIMRKLNAELERSSMRVFAGYEEDANVKPVTAEEHTAYMAALKGKLADLSNAVTTAASHLSALETPLSFEEATKHIPEPDNARDAGKAAAEEIMSTF